jgi:hypothetical protein
MRNSRWVRAARSEPQHHIAGAYRGAVYDPASLDHADGKAGQIIPAGKMPGISAISPPIRAQPACSQPSAMPFTTSAAVCHRASRTRSSPEKRAPLPAKYVVDAHRDEIDADGVVAAEFEASFSLVPTPSVRRPAPARDSRGAHSAPNPPMPARTSGRMVRLVRLDALDSFPGVDIDAGIAVAQRGPVRGSNSRPRAAVRAVAGTAESEKSRKTGFCDKILRPIGRQRHRKLLTCVLGIFLSSVAGPFSVFPYAYRASGR